MRKINFFNFNKEDEYKEMCTVTAAKLIGNYDFFFGGTCSLIKDIEILVKSKKDYYQHKIAIYYIQDECYFVLYRKNDIAVEVLTDCNGCQIAHFLCNRLKKINEFRAIEKEKEFDEILKQAKNL